MTRILAAVLVLSVAACSPPRAFEAAGLLLELAEPSGPAQPRAEPIGYRVDDRAHVADLYRPPDGARAGLVLVPGLTPEGKDDARFVPFARTLARAGFLVLVPEIPRLRQLKVDPADARPIADAVRHLAERMPSDSQIGLAAISYAAGPAFLAALEPEIGRRLGFVLAIGGYYDAEAALTFFTTGGLRASPEAPWQFRQPNAYGKWIFVRSNIERVVSPRDRVLLAAMVDRKLADPAASVDDLTADLGAEGRSIERLLRNRDPARVPQLIERLPAAIRQTIRDLDLKHRPLETLVPPVVLVHGRDDPIIPYSESRALRAALPPGRADLFLVDQMAHVELGGIGLGDSYTLWRAIYRILEARDSPQTTQD